VPLQMAGSPILVPAALLDSPLEFARQLTVREHGMFAAIRPRDTLARILPRVFIPGAEPKFVWFFPPVCFRGLQMAFRFAGMQMILWRTSIG
jgi:hypothetical protein